MTIKKRRTVPPAIVWKRVLLENEYVCVVWATGAVLVLLLVLVLGAICLSVMIWICNVVMSSYFLLKGK